MKQAENSYEIFKIHNNETHRRDITGQTVQMLKIRLHNKNNGNIYYQDKTATIKIKSFRKRTHSMTPYTNIY